MSTLEVQLVEHTRESSLWEPMAIACAVLYADIGVRFRRDSRGYASSASTATGSCMRRAVTSMASIHCDPVEKKLFFHVCPAWRRLSFGMLGLMGTHSLPLQMLLLCPMFCSIVNVFCQPIRSK